MAAAPTPPAGGPAGGEADLVRIFAAGAGWVALGGALGAVLRYGAGLAAGRLLGGGFPYGTALVNLVGCFAIGLAVGALEGRAAPALRALVLTGVLGGFTTFSSFGLETLHLIRSGRAGLALLNAAGQTALGVALVWAGASLAAFARARG